MTPARDPLQLWFELSERKCSPLIAKVFFFLYSLNIFCAGNTLHVTCSSRGRLKRDRPPLTAVSFRVYLSCLLAVVSSRPLLPCALGSSGVLRRSKSRQTSLCVPDTILSPCSQRITGGTFFFVCYPPALPRSRSGDPF